MEPVAARALLLAQHDGLRKLLADMAVVAARLCADESVLESLERMLDALRTAFAEHNASEERLLAPILRLDPYWGERRLARMSEEHAAEHLSFRQVLDRPARELAVNLADLVEEIEAHMAAEERTFLSPGVLRDGAAAAESADEPA